jgi:hypothetical protein
MTGFRSGRLVVLGLAAVQQKGRCIRWLCQCECGNTKEIDGQSLRRGLSRSCGCYQLEVSLVSGKKNITHGMKKTPEYAIWVGMRQRCNNPDLPNYKNYGGRGISVCDRWNNSFENFISDMGRKPTSGRYAIERDDNDGNYEPGNCRWATMMDQGINRRTNMLVTAFGETKALSAFFVGRSESIEYDRAYQRIKKHGWDAESAIVTPSLAR